MGPFVYGIKMERSCNKKEKYILKTRMKYIR